jgi:hypothetical protein
VLYKRTKGPLIIGIAPARRGFGYAVFDGPHKVIDWGCHEAKQGTNRQHLKKLRSILSWYAPDVLVLPNLARQKPRRSPRVIKLVQSFRSLADRRDLTIKRYTRRDIRAVFAGVQAQARYEIAKAIALQAPNLELWLPPKRRIWEVEDPRMSIFDAASLVFTHFSFASRAK